MKLTCRESHLCHVALDLICDKAGTHLTLYLAPLLMVGVYCGMALSYIDVLIDHAGEPRRHYLQVPVTDAEHHLRLLSFPDINEISDAENPLCLTSC